MIVKYSSYDLGYGKGFSVKEVIETMKKVTEVEFEVEVSSRRAGDPATLIANSLKVKSKMDWTPKYDDLELIYKSAYELECLV